MGQSITTKHRVEMSGGYTPALYFTRPRPSINRPADGPATDAGLAVYMERLVASMAPGGANEHLGLDRAPVSARLVDQDSGEVVARWAR